MTGASLDIHVPVPGAAAPRRPEFERRVVRLPYRLGEVALCEVPFRMWVWSGHFTVVAGDGSAHPAEAPRRFLSPDMLPNGRFDADGLAFPSYPTDEPLPRVALRDGFIRLVRAQYRRFVVDLTGTFEDYESRFSAKTRATLRRKVRRFADLSGGSLKWRVYRTPEEAEDFHATARLVSSTTYQEKLLGAGLPDSEAFRAETKRLARRGAMRGYVLFHGDRPVAYVYCPIVDCAVIYQYVGYDPEYREHSPGTVLQYLLLQSLFRERRFTLFDFTEGEGAHKELFSTGSVRCADLYFFRPSPKNVALIGLEAALASASRSAVALLKTLHLHRTVKALIRFGRP